MPNDHHHHEGCGHESHDHDHDGGDVGPNDNLFPYIDRPHVVALNGTGTGSSIIKPWHERMNEQVVRDSKVPFILVHSGDYSIWNQMQTNNCEIPSHIKPWTDPEWVPS